MVQVLKRQGAGNEAGAMNSHPTSHVPRLELDDGSHLWEAVQTASLDIHVWGGKFSVVQAEFIDRCARQNSEVLGDSSRNR